MADLTSASTGAGGLGTRAARRVLIAVWALGMISDLLGQSVAPPFIGEAFALASGLLAAVVLTRPGDQPLTPRLAFLVAGSTLGSAVGALASGAALGQSWSFNFAAYVAALLMPRGNVRAGLCGGAAIALLGLGWLLRHGASVSQGIDLLALPVLASVIGLIWRWLLTRIVAQEVSYHRDTARAVMASEVAEASAAATQAELARIGADARDVLTAIRDGHELDDALRVEISVVEAKLRDQIRSPDLQDVNLRGAVERARRRGVQVRLLGGGAGRSVLGPAVWDSVVEVVDQTDSGTLTLRVIPEGRLGAVSLLRADPRGGDERFVFDETGHLISRH